MTSENTVLNMLTTSSENTERFLEANPNSLTLRGEEVQVGDLFFQALVGRLCRVHAITWQTHFDPMTLHFENDADGNYQVHPSIGTHHVVRKSGKGP
jgi:hypothetical protein